MNTKILEIRDRNTFFAVLAVDMNPDNEAQRWHLRRVGYPCDGCANIAITHVRAGGDRCWNDPYGWNDGARTYPVAHLHIIRHWAELKDGDVIDVEFILGETQTKKTSERFEEGL
jgi:hypothetical protein